MKTAKELREQRQNLREQQLQILAEVREAGDWTAENRTKFDAMDADFVALDKDIERTERAEAIAAERATSKQPAANQETENDKFRRFLLMGEVPADRRGIESRANVQTITTTGGGYSIDTMLGPDISKALKAYGGVLEVARILQTASGEPLYWPTTDDTTVTPGSSINGHLLSINTAASTNADAVVYGQSTFGAYKATSGLLAIPRELVQDSAFDIVQFTLELLQERVKRVMDYYLTLGSGASEPKGVVTAATYGEVLTTASAYTRTDLLNLVHSLDPAYRMNGHIMMNDATLKIVRAITDTYGQPLYSPDPRLGAPSTIEGLPVIVNQRMATSASAAKTILVGDFSKFVVRLAGSMRIIRDESRLVDEDQIAVVAHWRFDSNILNSGSIKYGYESAT